MAADESLQERALRLEERQRMEDEILRDGKAAEIKGRAYLALFLWAVAGLAVLCPVTALVVGCSVRLFRFVTGY